MANEILQVKNLTKKFRSFIAVDNISFSLHEGEILGFLGPNGAGKTTTIQMLLGVLTPTAGKISYFGKEFARHREEILEDVNFSSTYTNLPWDLTVGENLTFLSFFYVISDRKARIAKIIGIFKLSDLLNKRVSELSAGQLTRLNLAKAFLNFPKVLLLDEPTASLDPDIASYIRKFLLEERDKFKVSILFTSHNMAEVEEVCDRVIFINQGRIIADDTPENLASSIEVCHVELLIPDNLEKILSYLKSKNLPFQILGKYIVVDVKEKLIPNFLRELTKQGVVYNEISIEKPTLEDYFLQVAVKGKG